MTWQNIVRYYGDWVQSVVDYFKRFL